MKEKKAGVNTKPDQKKLDQASLERQIKKQFEKAGPGKSFDAGIIASRLKLPNTQDSLMACLDRMTTKAQLDRDSNGRYRLPVGAHEFNGPDQKDTAAPVKNKAFAKNRKGAPVKAKNDLKNTKLLKSKGTEGFKEGESEGVADFTKHGAAYIICPELGKDVFVSPKHVGNALHRDTVKVRWYKNKKGSLDGEIMEVTKRSRTEFLGTLKISKNFAYVIPDHDNMPVDIYIPLDNIGDKAQEGDKVVATITRWHGGKLKSPVGLITAVLGQIAGNDMEMRSILLKNGFDIEFPKIVMDENELISDKITDADVAERRDFRSVTTFTIDPLTAKDFDDALSIQKLENGNWEIGVHIADVAHYVKPGTELDREAYRRSTSVYLVDRVAPMLPERLSNGVCSLRPNEDKCTFSAVFELNDNAKVINRWFGRTLIHSDRRFTYEEAQEILEAGEGEYADELRILNGLAHKMRAERYKNGAISFEAPEVQFQLDETGKPIGLKVKERKDAHLLIEDFMLLANKEVAGLIYVRPKGQPELPFVYRVHDTPNFDKLQELSRFADTLGYKAKFDGPGPNIAKALNKLIADSTGKPESEVLQNIAIRCMAKAAYTTDNIGHYGLGFEHYSHFTSPIRRYSDVLAHRILADYLNKNPRKWDKTQLEDECKHISAQERKAMECERESVKFKQVEYLQDHIGSEFKGIISGIAGHGIFVEIIENRCEGKITLDKFPEPLDPLNSLSLKGRKSHKIYQMGDVINIKVLRADLVKKQVDFAPVFDK